MDAQHWAAQWSERVPGQPQSAQFYDASLKASTFPKISGCMNIVVKSDLHPIDRCTCNPSKPDRDDGGLRASTPSTGTGGMGSSLASAFGGG